MCNIQSRFAILEGEGLWYTRICLQGNFANVQNRKRFDPKRLTGYTVIVVIVVVMKFCKNILITKFSSEVPWYFRKNLSAQTNFSIQYLMKNRCDDIEGALSAGMIDLGVLHILYV